MAVGRTSGCLNGMTDGDGEMTLYVWIIVTLTYLVPEESPKEASPQSGVTFQTHATQV